MSDVIRQEMMVFLYAVMHGAILTVSYDMLKILRRCIRHNMAAISAEDFLYWLAAGFFTFCFIFQRTDGSIRGYVAAGMFLGALLYHTARSSIKERIVFLWKKEYNKNGENTVSRFNKGVRQNGKTQKQKTHE